MLNKEICKVCRVRLFPGGSVARWNGRPRKVKVDQYGDFTSFVTSPMDAAGYKYFTDDQL